MRIWCERDSGVIAPSEQYVFALNVYDDDGQPASGVNIELTLDAAGEASALERQLTTDASGRVSVVIQAGKVRQRIPVRARADQATWVGTLFVTTLHINRSEGIRLSEVDDSLIRMLFWDREEVRVLRSFTGGQSGSRVFRVRVIELTRADITQVVKIGPADGTCREAESFHEHFERHLPNAAPIQACAVYGNTAAIVYGDARATGNLEPVVSLADYFQTRPLKDIRAALLAILNVGLRRVYVYHEVRPHTIRGLMNRFLPEHLVVSIGGTDRVLGVHKRDTSPSPSAHIRDLSPSDVENAGLEAAPGSMVALRGFRISKFQDDDLNLEDASQSRYKIKVRFDGALPHGFAPGDCVDVIARVVTTREAHLRFCIQHCLDVDLQKETFLIGGDTYPDPLSLLGSVLDQNCDVAWGSIHGDLHWGNVLIESPQNWRLIDYGLSCYGPTLFDFVKLEMYLRYAELAKRAAFGRPQILAFEQDLIDNPLGELPAVRHEAPELEKASEAIRAIRRMAQPYLVAGQFDYWRLLFSYAVALSKYYPSKDSWESHGGQSVHLERARDATFWALSVALTVGRVLRWEQYVSGRRAPKYRFLPIGTSLTPERKTVALDVGNATVPGVIDHHACGNERDCAASLVWKRPELVTTHLDNTTPEEVVWTVHEHPDFDCVASTYLALHRHVFGFFPPGAAELSQYALEVDAGAALLDTGPIPDRSPYALLTMRLQESGSGIIDAHDRDTRRMHAGFEVMDYICRLEAEGVHSLSTNAVPYEHPFWRATTHDRELFDTYDRVLGRIIQVRILIDHHGKEVAGLVMESPRSILFKVWARRAGFPLLVVRWAQSDKPFHRIVVSVAPNLVGGLNGLGRTLEAAEKKKREALGSRSLRPGPPRWPDVDNNDPWYDGRSPVHAYTIVDSPRMGTALELEEVLRIVLKGQWA